MGKKGSEDGGGGDYSDGDNWIDGGEAVDLDGKGSEKGGGLVGDWIDESDAGDIGGKDCEDGGGL